MKKEKPDSQVGPNHVLLVEDNPGDALLVSEYLKSDPMHPVILSEVTNLKDAESLLGTERFQVLLLDLNLPDSTGYDTFERIKSLAPNIPLIVLTGFEDFNLAEKCLENGAKDYLSKQWINGALPRTIWNTVKRFELESDLIETKTNLNLLVEQNPDGILVLSSKNEIRYLSPSADALFEGRLQLGGLFEFSLSGNSLTEITFDCSEGMTCVFELRVKDLVWLGENCLLVVIHDVTSRKKTENVLLARMKLIEEAEHTDLNQFLQFTLDVLGELTRSPIGFYHFLENDKKSLTLKAWSTRTLKEFCFAKGKDMQYDLEKAGVWADAVRTKKVVIHNDYERMPQKKGLPEGHARVTREIVIPVLRSDQVVAIVGLGNKPSNYVEDDVEMLSYLADVSWELAKHKRSEAFQNRLQAAIDQAEEVVIITDKSGAINYVNPVFERITGYSRAEVLGKNPRILKSGVQDEFFYQHLWETLMSGRTWRGRFINKCRDGRLVTFESSISPVKNESGEIVNFVAVKKDMTEQLEIVREKSEVEIQMRQSQKLESIGRLAGGVAHDFNNMLCVILGYGEEIIRKLHPSDPLNDLAKEIVNAGKKSTDLTRQLLAFSRKQTLNPKVINLNDVILNISKMLKRLIGEHIELKTELDKNLALALIDPGQLEQVIMNLVVNARDAMPNGGCLAIQTSNVKLDTSYVNHHFDFVPGNYVEILISDTGTGMDLDTMGRIFEPFFTTKSEGKGTGLGLSTVYGIVKQSSGNIWVSSKLGVGTTFKVQFPETQAKEIANTEKQNLSQTSKKGAMILVVEDEPSLRKLIKTQLESEGFKVVVASNGGEAILLIEEKGLRPDLVLTDVVMPGINGKILVERILRTMPQLKYMFMSGYTGDDLQNFDFLEEGKPFLHKPFRPKELYRKIYEVLS